MPKMDSQSDAQAENGGKAAEEFNVGVWVFAGLSLLTLTITLIRGIVPIEVLEAALWATLAWVWHKRRLAGQSSKDVLIMLAILIAGGEGYLFGLHEKAHSNATATSSSLPPGFVLEDHPSSSPQPANTSSSSDPFAKYIVKPSSVGANGGASEKPNSNRTEISRSRSANPKAEEDTPEAATTRLQEPDLSKLNFDEETSIEEACISEKGDGPAAYYRCLNHQLRLLESAPKYQDLSDLGFTETTSIDEACISAKGDGPAAYNRCLTYQLRLLGVRPKAAAPQQ